jgi:hypothetical protein
MTDATSTFAGNYAGGLRVTCILDEGAPTVSSKTYAPDGTYKYGTTWASELEEGDYVAISNDTAATFSACKGVPLVEKAVNGETFVIGKIVSTPKLQKQPLTDAAADTLAERLAGGYYRTANVEIMGGITKIEKATVMCDGSNATTPGTGTTLKFNITSGYASGGLQLDSAASGGVGIIPFHYVPAGTDGDTYSCLVGITGLLIAVTGA